MRCIKRRKERIKIFFFIAVTPLDNVMLKTKKAHRFLYATIRNVVFSSLIEVPSSVTPIFCTGIIGFGILIIFLTCKRKKVNKKEMFGNKNPLDL